MLASPLKDTQQFLLNLKGSVQDVKVRKHSKSLRFLENLLQTIIAL